MYTRELTDKMDLFVFDPEDVIELLDKPAVARNFYRMSDREVETSRNWVRTSGDSFYGNMSIEQCKEAMRGEYQYGAERLENAIASVDSQRYVNRLVSSVVGGCPNVGAYLSGRYNNMWNMQRELTPSKAVRILLLSSWSALDDHSVIMLACERITPYIVGLELSGVQCEIFIAFPGLYLYCRRGRNRQGLGFCSLFNVKSFGQRLNAGRTAFMCGTPAFIRRVRFDIYFSFEGFSAKGGKLHGTAFAHPLQVDKLRGYINFDDIPELQGAKMIDLREVVGRSEAEYPEYIRTQLCR